MKKLVSQGVSLGIVFVLLCTLIFPIPFVFADSVWQNEFSITESEATDGTLTWSGAQYNGSGWSTQQQTVEGALFKASFATKDNGTSVILGFNGASGQYSANAGLGDSAATAYSIAVNFYRHEDTTRILIPSFLKSGAYMAEAGGYAYRKNIVTTAETAGVLQHATIGFEKDTEKWNMTIKYYTDNTFSTQQGNAYVVSVPFTEVPANAFAEGKAYPFWHASNMPAATDISLFIGTSVPDPVETVSTAIDGLSTAAETSYFDKENVLGVKQQYDALTPVQKAQVSAERVEKITILAERFAQADAVAEDWKFATNYLPQMEGGIYTFTRPGWNIGAVTKNQFLIDGFELGFSVDSNFASNSAVVMIGLSSSDAAYKHSATQTQDNNQLIVQLYSHGGGVYDFIPHFAVTGDIFKESPRTADGTGTTYEGRKRISGTVGGKVFKIRVIKNSTGGKWEIVIHQYDNLSSMTTPTNTYNLSVPFSELPENSFTNGKANVFFHAVNESNPFTTKIGLFDEFTSPERVAAMIEALPAVSNVSGADKGNVDTAKAAYDALTTEEKGQVAAALVQKLNDLIDALTVTPPETLVVNAITALPQPADITLSHKSTVDAAKASYDTLNDTQKAAISTTLKAKLDACVERIAALDIDGIWTYDGDVLAYENSYIKYNENGLYEFYTQGGDLGGRTKKEYDVDRLRVTVQWKDFALTGSQVRIGITDNTDKPNFASTSLTSMLFWEIYCISASSADPDENVYNTMAEYASSSGLVEVGQYQQRKELYGDFSNTVFTFTLYKDTQNSRWVTILQQFANLQAVDVEEPIFEHESVISFAQLAGDAFTDNKAHVIFYSNAHGKLFTTYVGNFRQAPEYTPTPNDEDVINEVADLIEALPSVDDLTLADKEDVLAAKAAYDALDDTQKEKISATLVYKLEQLLERLEQLEKKRDDDSSQKDDEGSKNPGTGASTSTAAAVLTACFATAYVVYKKRKR